jgi:Zn-dependent peptidase ImmA (M78 family)
MLNTGKLAVRWKALNAFVNAEDTRMSRDDYYEGLKVLARQKRDEYGVTTVSFGLREVRAIYRKEGIRIDHWPLSRKIKAVYMCDDGEPSVAIQRSLPDEPKLFALVHELKHHFCDQEQIRTGGVVCGDYNLNELIEKGAEVFAAEFIYPELEFVADIGKCGVVRWQAPDVVRFKRNCKAKVSYKFICKRLERLRLIEKGSFDKVKFKQLEDQMFGVPLYRSRHCR